MGKVDDAELSQINAPVKGASVKKKINWVEKDDTCLETKRDSVTLNNSSNDLNLYSPMVTETWTYNYSLSNPSYGNISVTQTR